MKKPTSARGLFRATGKTAKPIMVDLIDGQPFYAKALERTVDDFYPTPPEPTRSFLHAEGNRLRSCNLVWECAAGDGAMVREMEGSGLRVVASDLIDRGCRAEIRSFYDFQKPMNGADAIVTNPPFAECNKEPGWVRHAVETLGVGYVALLLPLGWPGAMQRAMLWDQYPPARVYLMRWRIDFTGAGAPPMLNAWFVWDGKTQPGETRLLMLDRADGRQGEMFGAAS